jgi:CelD/BcsL family acetyltransferase involved in cellulose biosynthesis
VWARSARMVDVSDVVIGVVEDSRGFAELEEEWEDLHRQCPWATPFLSWAWLYSWWEAYGENYELRLITVRNARGLLVGILPFMIEFRNVFVSRLLFVGTESSDYLDVIVRAGWEDKVLESGTQALKKLTCWRIADLQQLRAEAAAWGIHRRWDGPRTRLRQNSCPVVEIKPWDELLASLSRNLRSTTRRALRRAAADGLQRMTADTSNIKQAAKRLVALHREAWQGRNIGPEHFTQRYEAFIVAAAERLANRGLGTISEFWQDGEVLISCFLLFGRDFCGSYVLGASQNALQRYQWSSLYIWDAVEIAHGNDNSYLDLLRGEEPYKLRWSSRIIPTDRLILGQHRTARIPYAGYHALRPRAKLYAGSRSAPLWIKSAVGKYRTLRHRVNHSRDDVVTGVLNIFRSTGASRVGPSNLETMRSLTGVT